MPTEHLILFGLVLPAILAGVLALVGSFVFREIRWGTLLGLCGGLILAYWGIAGTWPPVPPIEVPERVVLLGAMFGVIAIIASSRKVPWVVRLVLAIVFPAVMVWFVFKPIPVVSMPRAMMWQIIGIAAGIAFILSCATEGIAMRKPGVAAPLILGPVAAGAGAIQLFVGTVTLGWLGACIALMILGWMVAALIRKSLNFSRGPVYVVLTLLAGLFAYDYFESGNITLWEIALLAVAPLLAWIVEIPPLGKLKNWQREVLRVILVFIPVGIAAGIAFVQFKKDSAEM